MVVSGQMRGGHLHFPDLCDSLLEAIFAQVDAQTR
jgi:hypothetical protein